MTTAANTSSGTQGGSSAAISVAHTVPAQDQDRVVVAHFFSRGSSNAGSKVGGIQLNGVSPSGTLADVEANEFGNFVNLQTVYWLENDLPNNGTASSFNVTGTTGAANFQTGIIIVSMTSAFQGAPTAGTPVTNTGTPTTSSCSVTTTATNALVIDGLGVWHTGTISGVTPTAGQTEAGDIGPASADRMSVGYESAPTVTTYTQTWSWTGSANLYVARALAVENTTGSSPINVETGAQGTAGAPVSHTLTGAANRIVLVETSDEGTNFPSGVTYNGVAMTLIVQAQSVVGAGNTTSLWGILDVSLPGAGTYNVVVSGTGYDGNSRVRVTEINNALQALPTGSQIDDANAGAVATITATATAPSGFVLGWGLASHGNDANAFTATPSGTGTWVRRFTDFDGGASIHTVGATQQFFESAGSKDYTETSAVSWNRASSLVAFFRAFSEAAENTFFHGLSV